MLLHATPDYRNHTTDAVPGTSRLAEGLSLQDPLAGLDIDSRAYQQRIVRKACEMFTGERRNRTGQREGIASSVLVDSPTGSGKTVMGLAVARYMQAVYGYKVGWVAMRRTLLQQAARENIERGFNIDMQTISMFEKRPPRVDLLVIDEAQHDAPKSMANLHCMIGPKVVLGLTATPFSTERVGLRFEKVIRDSDIHQLIQNGYLSRYHHYELPEYTPASLAKIYLAEPRRWGKSLIFFRREEECRECLRLLQDAGVKAEVVVGQTNRQRQFDAFVSGETEVLISTDPLTEGFDCPDLRTVFCRPAGRSFTIRMAGRVFREHPIERIKQVVQCKATQYPLVKMATADQQFVWVGGRWLTAVHAKSVQRRQRHRRAYPLLPKVSPSQVPTRNASLPLYSTTYAR